MQILSTPTLAANKKAINAGESQAVEMQQPATSGKLR